MYRNIHEIMTGFKSEKMCKLATCYKLHNYYQYTQVKKRLKMYKVMFTKNSCM